MRSFGQELGRLRMSRGVSQVKLAELIGVGHSAVSRWECENRDPTRENVNRVADALNCTETERFALMTAAGFAVGLGVDPAVLALNEWLVDPGNDEREREKVRLVIEAMTALLVERPRLAMVRRGGRAA